MKTWEAMHPLWIKFQGINETRYFMQGNVPALNKVQLWLDKNLVDPDERARFLQHKCYALHFQNRPLSEIHATLEEGMGIAKERQSKDLEEIFLRFQFEIIDANITQWERTLSRAQKLLDTTNDLQKMAYWFWEFSWSKYWLYLGDQKRAHAYLKRSLSIAQRNNRSSHIAITCLYMANVFMEQHNYEPAYDYSQKAYTLIERLNPRLMGEALLNKGTILCKMGNIEDGVSLLQAAANPKKIFSHPKAKNFAHVTLLEQALKQQSLDNIEQILDRIEQSEAQLEWWKRDFGESLLRSAAHLRTCKQVDHYARCCQIFMTWWDGVIQLDNMEEILGQKTT